MWLVCNYKYMTASSFKCQDLQLKIEFCCWNKACHSSEAHLCQCWIMMTCLIKGICPVFVYIRYCLKVGRAIWLELNSVRWPLLFLAPSNWSWKIWLKKKIHKNNTPWSLASNWLSISFLFKLEFFLVCLIYCAMFLLLHLFRPVVSEAFNAAVTGQISPAKEMLNLSQHCRA